MGLCTSLLEKVSLKKKPSEQPVPESLIRQVTSIRESFILLKILGSGTFGNVILVKDKQTGLERAAKELIKGSFDTSQFPLFLQELMILKSLVIASQDHPSVMNFYEIIETSTRFYVITEYLSGGQLFERFSKSPVVNEKIAAKCLFDVIISLNYIHANGLNHKDIKPENLLFEFEAPDAHLKLVDYGFSLLKKTSSGIKGPVGSVTYMAPEKFKGEENDKSDVWSMGVILFIILSGRVPFQGKTDSETIQKILNKPLSMNSKAWETVSEPAKRLVSKMLDKNPENRPSSQEIMMDDWFMSYTKDSITSTAFHPDTVLSISKFHSKCKLEKSLFTFIASNIASKNDETKLRELFIKFDKNGDGTLSTMEINDGYDFIGCPPPPPVLDLLKKIGTTGVPIHHQLFISHIKNWNKKMQLMELEQAFTSYEQGGDGKVSLDELKAAIPGIEGSEWTQILYDADINGDGMMTLDELKEFILANLNNS